MGQESIDNCNEGKRRRKDDSFGQDSIENSNDVRMRRKEEPQPQLPVKFHLGQNSMDNKLLKHICLPQDRAWVRISLAGLFAEHFGQNTVMQEEFLEPGKGEHL